MGGTRPSKRAGLRSATPAFQPVATTTLTPGNLLLSLESGEPCLLGDPLDDAARQSILRELLQASAADTQLFTTGWRAAHNPPDAAWSKGEKSTIASMMQSKHPDFLRRIEASNDHIKMAQFMGSLPVPLREVEQNVPAVANVLHTVQDALEAYEDRCNPAPQIDTQLILTAPSTSDGPAECSG